MQGSKWSALSSHNASNPLLHHPSDDAVKNLQSKEGCCCCSVCVRKTRQSFLFFAMRRITFPDSANFSPIQELSIAFHWCLFWSSNEKKRLPPKAITEEAHAQKQHTQHLHPACVWCIQASRRSDGAIRVKTETFTPRFSLKCQAGAAVAGPCDGLLRKKKKDSTKPWRCPRCV